VIICAGRKRGRGDSDTGGRRKGGTSLSDEPERIEDMPVDPNEPTYCLCQQVSYGEMIACDNADVSLTTSPTSPTNQPFLARISLLLSAWLASGFC
jgi:hypothetical protein